MSDDHLPFSVQATQTESGKQITFHVQDDTLGDFITKLLGQPHSIRKRFPAIFQLDHGWFNNLHELLTQRISQQNKYKLIQFSAKIYFDDGLVRTVNSAEAFISFVEVKPLISVGCSMTWTFLIFFASKSAPEKQEVKVTVMSEILMKSRSVCYLWICKLDLSSWKSITQNGPGVMI
jgi:hypothetical protein